MTKIVQLDVLEKIIKILLSNQNKINLLRNDLNNKLLEGNNSRKRINQFLNGLEIDIKNILSLLNRERIDINKNNQNEIQKTYYLNNDKNILQDLIICGCCECCRCQKCCDCSTNNFSENQQLNMSNNNKNNKNNEYIKENINFEEDDKNNEFQNKKIFNEINIPNYNFQPSSSRINQNYTNPNFNYDDIYNNNNFNNNKCRTLNPNNEQNLNIGNNQGILINSRLPYFSNNYDNNKKSNNFPNQFGYIKNQLFNNMDKDDYNLPINEKIKNSAIMKSKRFHNSRSFDNIQGSPYSNKNKAKIITTRNNNYPIENKNNINNNYNNLINRNFINENNNINNNGFLNMNDIDKSNFSNKKNKKNNNLFNKNYDNNNNNLAQKKKKMDKINNIQNFLNKLYKQPEDIINRFKNIYGNDIEEKLLNEDIDNNNLNEMENILDKIIKISIWGKDDNIKNKKRIESSSLDKKGKRWKKNFVYNPVQEKIKLIQSVKDKQAYFREFPRGWYSTKEYFINNGTEINNENINKYI